VDQRRLIFTTFDLRFTILSIYNTEDYRSTPGLAMTSILLFLCGLCASVAITLFEKTKPICRPLAGNLCHRYPKHETRNPKQIEKVRLKKQSQC